MRTETRTQEWFLRKPECRKWIRQCSSCGTYGRDEQRPPLTLGFDFDVMFHPMVLDEMGRCDQCQDAICSASIEPPIIASASHATVHRTLDSLPAPSPTVADEL